MKVYKYLGHPDLKCYQVYSYPRKMEMCFVKQKTQNQCRKYPVLWKYVCEDAHTLLYVCIRFPLNSCKAKIPVQSN